MSTVKNKFTDKSLSHIKANTKKWKESSRENQFRLFNNGAGIRISRAMYTELKKQYVSASDGENTHVRLYLGIETTLNSPRKDNLVVYLVSDNYDKTITESTFDPEKIFVPEVVADWIGSETASDANAMEHNKLPKVLFDVPEPQQIVQRFFKWMVYGAVWKENASRRNTVQVFEIPKKNLDIIFEKTHVTDAVAFFGMHDYKEGQISHLNEVEVLFCAKSAPPSTQKPLEEFLKFYCFKNITTPYPPFSPAGRTFSLLDMPM